MAIAQVAAVSSRSKKSVSTSRSHGKVGKDGVITTEESRGMRQNWKSLNMQFDRGLPHTSMVTDNEKWWQTLKIHTFDH